MAKPPLKERLKKLFEDYGSIAIYVYFGLSILTIIGFALAFTFGFSPTDSTGFLGILLAAWIAGKATFFIRIPIAIALTPVVAHLAHRKRKPAAQSDDSDPK